MKVFVSTFLVTSFLFIAVFGLKALEHNPAHPETDCAFSIMLNASCPLGINNVVGHHISAIQSLSNVPLNIFILSIILLAFVSLLSFSYLFQYLFLHNQFLTRRLQEYRFRLNSIQRWLIAWLSLFELSPSA